MARERPARGVDLGRPYRFHGETRLDLPRARPRREARGRAGRCRRLRRSLGARACPRRRPRRCLSPRPDVVLARARAGSPRLGPRRLPLRALQEGDARGCLPVPRLRGRGRIGTHAGSGGVPGSRSHQYAGGGHDAERSCRRGVGACERARCAPAGGHRRCAARRGLPRDPCGGACERSPPAAHRPDLGTCGRATPHPGREGCVLRLRRTRHQVGERYATDEEGHGRGGPRHRARRSGHVHRAAGAAAPARARGGERHRGQRVSAGRRDRDAQGSDHRGGEHRRGRSDRAERRSGRKAPRRRPT